MRNRSIRLLAFRAGLSALLALTVSPLQALAGPAAASKEAAQRSFGTPEQAAQALGTAAGQGDVPALLAICGSGSKALVETGDPVRDKQDRERFVAKAHEKTAIVYDSADPNVAVLAVGKDGWPTPVPIVRANGKWH